MVQGLMLLWLCGRAAAFPSKGQWELQAQWEEHQAQQQQEYKETTISPVLAAFRFAAIFQDHMVLQREPLKAVLWGFSSPLATVSLAIDASPAGTAKANASGVWLKALPPQPASGKGSHTISATSSLDKDGINITDVLFGDVWVCGGQSNMAFSMGTPLADLAAQAKLGMNASADIADAANYPNIRVTTIGDLISETPIPDFYPTKNASFKIHQPWTRASPDSIGSGKDVMGNGHFSAVCYYYGRGLYQSLKVPIGLVSSSWGGTALEDWMDYDTLQPGTSPPGGDCPGSISGHACCGGKPMQQYNGMIRPMQNMTIKGVVFYQGESNHGEDQLYTCRFTKMMAQWRRQWHEGTAGSTDLTFPFGIVQVGPTIGADEDSWKIRQGQVADYGYCPNEQWPRTFLATAYDLPNPPGTHCISGCVHIFNKPEVGRRLAAAGLTFVYKSGSSAGSGPRVQSAAANNYGVELTFTHTSEGLDLRSNLSLEVLVQPRMPSGSWEKVFQHDTTKANNTWATKLNFLSINAHDTEAAIFSRLGDLQRFYGGVGELIFKMSWPGTNFEDQIWAQTSNPAAESSVLGYRPISVPHTTEHWGGLKLTTKDNCDYDDWCCIDGDTSKGFWYAVALTRNFQGGYPGPDRNPAGGESVPQVQLFVLNQSTVATPSQTWVPATATSHTKTSMLLGAKGVRGQDIIAVRYAYADTPCPNQQCAIYNSEGFPSAPFILNVTTAEALTTPILI